MENIVKNPDSKPLTADVKPKNRPRILLPVSLLVPPLGLLVFIWYLSMAVKDKKKLSLAFGLLPLILAVVGATGYLFLYNNVILPKPYKYQYQSLSSYNLPGKQAKTGAVFDKPAELSWTGPKGVLSKADFVHNLNKDSASQEVAAITVTSVQDSKAAAVYLKPITKFPDMFSKQADFFVKDELRHLYYQKFPSSDLSYKLNKPVVLTTSNLKSNAVVYDFTATHKNATPKHLKGKLVIALGSRNYYYLLLSSVDYNWKSNQDTWQKVINSLQIDQ